MTGRATPSGCSDPLSVRLGARTIGQASAMTRRTASSIATVAVGSTVSQPPGGHAASEGGRFEGWSEHFRYDRWVAACPAELAPRACRWSGSPPANVITKRSCPGSLDSGLGKDWLGRLAERAGRTVSRMGPTATAGEFRASAAGLCRSTGADIQVGFSR